MLKTREYLRQVAPTLWATCWLFPLCLLTLACSEERQPTAQNNAILVLNGRLSLHNPSRYYPTCRAWVSYWQNPQTKIDYLYLFDRHQQQLTRVPFTNGTADARTTPLNLPMGAVADGCWVQSSDSLYLLGGNMNTVYLTNAKGAIKQRWPVSPWAGGPNQFRLHTGSNPLYYRHKRLYIQQETISKETIFDSQQAREAYYRFPLGVVVDLNQPASEVFNNTGLFPKMLTAQSTYLAFWANTAIGKNDEYVFSFSPDPVLHIYEANGEKKTVSATSRFYRPMRPISNNRLADDNYVAQYELSQGRYQDVIYDPFNRVYYRIYVQGIAATDGLGRRNSFAAKPWSIIVLNDAFQKLGETEMPLGANPFTVTPTRRGLLVAAYTPAHPSFRPDSLVYYVYKTKR